MAVVYPASDEGRIDRWSYWTARFARIYPIFFISMVFGSALSAVIPWRELVINMMGMQSWYQSSLNSINPPAWSVSVEFTFYAAFPFLIPLFNKERIGMAAIFVSIVYALCVAFQFYDWNFSWLSAEFVRDLKVYSPIAHFHEFLLGVLAGSAYSQGKFRHLSRGFIIPLLIVLLIFSFLYWKIPVLIYFGIFLPVAFVWLIFSISNYEGTRFTWAVGTIPILLGESSYAIYILQYPVRIAWVNIVQPKFNLPDPGIAIYLVALVLLSIIAHLAIERPSRRIIKGLFGSRFGKVGRPTNKLTVNGGTPSR